MRLIKYFVFVVGVAITGCSNSSGGKFVEKDLMTGQEHLVTVSPVNSIPLAKKNPENSAQNDVNSSAGNQSL